MFLDVRVNGHWIRMQCADTKEAAHALTMLTAGGSLVDVWVGREEGIPVDIAEALKKTPSVQ